MLYAALDEATARSETYLRRDGLPAEATVATFELTEDITVLNLAEIPGVPSIFAGEWIDERRESLIFLHAFVEALTDPVVKDGREHVEYVPSQVVTEYVRYRLPELLEKAVHGLIYPSARQDGGVGCVLFVSYEEINAEFMARKAPFRLLQELTTTAAVDTT